MKEGKEVRIVNRRDEIHVESEKGNKGIAKCLLLNSVLLLHMNLNLAL